MGSAHLIRLALRLPLHPQALSLALRLLPAARRGQGGRTQGGISFSCL